MSQVAPLDFTPPAHRLGAGRRKRRRASREARQRRRERLADQEWEEARRREQAGDLVALPEALLELGRAAEALANMESSGLLSSQSSWLDENGAVSRWRLD